MQIKYANPHIYLLRTTPLHNSPSPSISKLFEELLALNPAVDQNEAFILSREAITYPMLLANRYRLIAPPWFHNCLVNLKIKKRGLCYQWTEDLLSKLRSLKLSSFQFHWGVAHQGQLFKEHNSAVVTAKNCQFKNGLVLDPWRTSGKLYWKKVIMDSYPWKKRIANFRTDSK